MTDEIQYPSMRAQIVSALESLSDPVHQSTRWGRVEEGVNYYDDFSMAVHILYDDTTVLPSPENSVPSLLHPEEVPALRALDEALDPMITDLSGSPDEVYLADPRWAGVVGAARTALLTMRSSDQNDPPAS
ncbi:SCO4402 family protein [Jiangella endophytica]|uniref:SCO4402 family protein n=1 Tax=Jiangella endophytica TaxID=1623398 RepID=UPI000E349C37|nr:hypothetical protein [Jiangella endophytica]